MFIRPGVPYFDPVFLKIADVRVAFKEPKEFMNNGRQMELLCGDHWESISEVKPHLVSKHREGSSARSVTFFDALVQDVFHQVEVRLHDIPFIAWVGEALDACSSE